MENEICICAAVIADDGTIVRGHRHSTCVNSMRSMKKTAKHTPESQGFITSRNRFVSRKEGYFLQLKAGIKSVNKGGYWGGELYSEDLY